MFNFNKKQESVRPVDNVSSEAGVSLGYKEEGVKIIKMINGLEPYVALINEREDGFVSNDETERAKNEYYGYLSAFPEEVKKCNGKSPEECAVILKGLRS